MITLRLPADHPHNAVIMRWAQDKEAILTTHEKDIRQIQGVLKQILINQQNMGLPS